MQGNAPARDLSELLADLIKAHSGYRPSVGFEWYETAQGLINEHGEDTVEACVRHSQADFWQRFVASMDDLERRWDSIHKQVQRDDDKFQRRDRLLRKYETTMSRAYELVNGEKVFLDDLELQALVAHKREKLAA
jgi:hypothetical protein